VFRFIVQWLRRDIPGRGLVLGRAARVLRVDPVLPVRFRFVAERGIAVALLAAGVLLPVAALARRRTGTPTALLFVSRGCGHCLAAAARFDSLTTRLGVRAVLVVDSGSWAKVAPHVTLARDSGHALARALSIRAVPAFVSLTAVVRYDFDR
jgi:hypothetical protein